MIAHDSSEFSCTSSQDSLSIHSRPTKTNQRHKPAVQSTCSTVSSTTSRDNTNPANLEWRSFEAKEAEAFEKYLYSIKQLRIPRSETYPILSLSRLLSVDASHPALSPFVPKTFRDWVQFRISRLEDQSSLLRGTIASYRAQREADCRNRRLGIDPTVSVCLGGKAEELASLLRWTIWEPSVREVADANGAMDRDWWFRCQAEFWIGHDLLQEM